MYNSQSMRQDQRQKLVMSQQLQQAVKLLQLSNLDLNDYLRDAIESNPFLDSHIENGTNDIPASGADPRLDERPFEEFAPTDWHKPVQQHSDEDYDSLSVLSNDDLSLHEHLRQQLMLTSPDMMTQALGLFLIDAVLDTGYLAEPLEDLAQKAGVDMPTIEKVHQLCTTFEPTGVFARSTAECLMLQLKERQLYTPAMARLLERLPDAVKKEKRVQQALAQHCCVSPSQLQQMLETLRSLHPKPGYLYSSSDSYTVIPDVIIRQVGDEWRAELNQQSMPKISVNQQYYQSMLAAQQPPKPQAGFVRDSFKNACWLVNSLERREKTIIRVANEILVRQRAFFEKGVTELRPMTLKDVAETLELHESTISRVTGNKYLRCARGVFCMRFFFMSGVHTTDSSDEIISSQTVKHRIKSLIDQETLDNVLSDDDLVKKLERLGVQIARRTVTKYREAMGLGSSRDRKALLLKKAEHLTKQRRAT